LLLFSISISILHALLIVFMSFFEFRTFIGVYLMHHMWVST
jgi:hypothetical protein